MVALKTVMGMEPVLVLMVMPNALVMKVLLMMVLTDAQDALTRCSTTQTNVNQ